MKKLLLAALCTLILAGCRPDFLKQEEIDHLSYPSSGESRIIYYKKHFRFNGDGELSITTHMLIRIGENVKAHPEFLYVFDSPAEQLVRYDARIASAAGKARQYGKGDLSTLNLSSRRVISDQNMKYLPITGDLSAGDLLETSYEHNSTLASVGASFSLNELRLDANNITCEIEYPESDSLLYTVLNDKDASSRRTAGGTKTAIFQWDSYSRETESYELAKRDRAAGVIACVLAPISQRRNAALWSPFGAWYMNLVGEKLKSDADIHSLAEDIVRGKEGPKEKLDAIFDYCQRNIRYEQVYFDRGELIPHSCQEILKNKYGDCKDYSTAIYTLAHSIGIDAHLAMIYRGRGVEFKENVPASQFNHMIVHYREGGTDHWYDGTNRTGIPGIVSEDLINQRALVLGVDSSYLVTIRESEHNLLSITGSIAPMRNGFSADLQVGMKNQFAIGFFTAATELNQEKMNEFLQHFLKSTLHHSMMIEKMTWSKSDSAFTIGVRCIMPNSRVVVGAAQYSSLGKLFPDLFPSSLKLRRNETYYFPYYNKVAIDLKVEKSGSDTTSAEAYKQTRWQYRYAIDPGPYDETQLESFIGRFAEIAKEFNNNIKFND